jgi:hypothetical protein
MKTTFLRNTFMAAALVAGLSLTSCKEKTETETETTETETLETTEGYESPIDTVVTDNDTIIDTGDASRPNKNPVGTQVP